MTKPPKIRCAIYTRKSTEEGLEQEFNSLDAQRVAAEAYIQSQKHEGWELIPTRYDDGGFSGGTLERPALKALMHDIEQGKVDAIVVYKVDRLSRSLSDFARLVDIFDKHNVSFVSVTQAFNTTNSMGRLTLNILLSFAQFEREVTGERIRDKFAASKKKGMWMGGPLPLGYDLNNRKLIVNEEEAKQVRLIYEKYLEFKSMNRLVNYLTENGYHTKSWVKPNGEMRQGGPYEQKSIGTVLCNYLYLGKIKHKGNVYEGEQEALIDQETWDKVQERIKINSVKRTSYMNRSHDHIFRGRLFDETGQRFITHYSEKNNRRHFYYFNKLTKRSINVVEFNAIIATTLKGLDLEKLNLSADNIPKVELAARYASSFEKVCDEPIDKVIMAANHVTIIINKTKLIAALERADANTQPLSLEDVPPIEVIDKNETIEIILHVAFRRRAGRRMGFAPNGKAINIHKNNYDKSLVLAITRAYKWNKMIDEGQAKSIKHIAEMEKVERTYAGDVLRLKYLSPEITMMILNGTQPRNLSVTALLKNPIPLDWEQQRTLLNIM